MADLFFHLGEVADAKRLVKTFHYSHRWPAAVALVGTFHEPGGLLGDSGPAVAACVFGQPAARWGEPVLELTRLVRVEGERVALSGLVSKTAKWVGRKGLGDLLVSFADATVGHHGGIYQACSWRYAGQRASRMDGLEIDGRFVPGRNANHTYGTQSVEKLAALGVDAVPHYDIGKHLYWLPLNKSGRRKADRLLLESLPYPKPDAIEAAA
jgi:hypothetical protein